MGLRVKKEDIEITSLKEEINKLILEANIELPAPDKARLEVNQLEFHLPPPIIPTLPPSPPIILPPVSIKLQIK